MKDLKIVCEEIKFSYTLPSGATNVNGVFYETWLEVQPPPQGEEGEPIEIPQERRSTCIVKLGSDHPFEPAAQAKYDSAAPTTRQIALETTPLYARAT